MMSESSSGDQPCQSLHGLIASCEILQKNQKLKKIKSQIEKNHKLKKIHKLKKKYSQIESLLGELVLLNQAGDQ